ncbi:hypothetical protein B484DRAFT_420089, partial [Ochromonadaceae sp. CCMP2298]
MHSAKLQTSAGKEAAKREDAEKGAVRQTGHKNVGEAEVRGGDNMVYSMCPVFVQQDLYCLSTKTASEHQKWPLRSGGIINHSSSISAQTASEYRQAYRDSAVVKNALQGRANRRGGGRLFDDDDFDGGRGWRREDGSAKGGLGSVGKAFLG